jgi:hypothetical protein
MARNRRSNRVGNDDGKPAIRLANFAQDGHLFGDVVSPICGKRGRDSGILIDVIHEKNNEIEGEARAKNVPRLESLFLPKIPA